MNTIIVIFADYIIFLIPIVVLGIFLSLKKKQKIDFLLYAVILAVCSYFIAFVADILWYNPRPFVLSGELPLVPSGDDNGFPSGHTLFAAVFAMSFFFVHRKTSYVLLFVAVLIGLARVFADVHHYVDIFASIFVVIVGGVIAFIFDKKLFHACIK